MLCHYRNIAFGSKQNQTARYKLGQIVGYSEAAQSNITLIIIVLNPQTEMFKLENDVVEYKTKYEEMLEENDQVKLHTMVLHAK